MKLEMLFLIIAIIGVVLGIVSAIAWEVSAAGIIWAITAIICGIGLTILKKRKKN